MIQLDTRHNVSSPHGIPLSVIIQEKILTAKPSRHETKCWTVKYYYTPKYAV